MHIADVLASMQDRGIKLWMEKGQLKFRAPVGALDPRELQQLRMRKGEIIAYLERAQTVMVEPPLIARAPSDPVPLTFTQRWLWNIHRNLKFVKSRRECALALHIQGRLHRRHMDEAMHQVVRRHEALRTSIVTVDGSPRQQVAERHDSALEFIDLTGVAIDGTAEARRLVEELVNERINISEQPLFAARLLRLAEEEHVLAVAAHHVISDRESLQLIMRDLLVSYERLVAGLPSSLPALPVQFPDYAVWQQREQTQQAWTAKHGAYWAERLQESPRVRLPRDVQSARTSRLRMAREAIRFDKQLSEGLRELSLQRQTTLAMSVFATYVVLLAHTCNVRDLLVGFIAMGRHRAELENMVGFLAGILYVRVEVREDDTFAALLKRVTSESLDAHEHYDMARFSATPSAFARNTHFNWSYISTGRNVAIKHLTINPFHFTVPEAGAQVAEEVDISENEPSVMFVAAEEEILGTVFYRPELFHKATMERFVERFRSLAASVVENPDALLATLRPK